MLRGAADELLAILKNENLKAPEKKVEIEKLVNPISSDKFADITDISRKINDYTDDAGKSVEGSGDMNETGVAVVFDEDEDDDGSDFEIKDEDSEEEDDGGDEEAEPMDTMENVCRTITSSYSYGSQEEDGSASAAASQGNLFIDPREIDAYWLQRKISTFESDPNKSQEMSEKVLELLQGNDSRFIENELVFLLDYERFDFIKLLLKNKKKSMYFTTWFKQC